MQARKPLAHENTSVAIQETKPPSQLAAYGPEQLVSRAFGELSDYVKATSCSGVDGSTLIKAQFSALNTSGSRGTSDEMAAYTVTRQLPMTCKESLEAEDNACDMHLRDSSYPVGVDVVVGTHHTALLTLAPQCHAFA